MAAYLISDEGNISIVLKGKQYFVSSTDGDHPLVMDALKSDKTEDEILLIIDKEARVQDYLEDSDVKIKDGCVIYQEEEVHNALTEKIIGFMRLGLPVQPLINFLKNMMKNPSFASRKELFDFLSHKSLPITEDGCFLAYKAVGNNFMDKWSGTVDNSIGETPTMARFGVDDDRNNGCSAGLHAGTLEYVQSYGRFCEDEDSTDQCIIVKINPEDVVSVPTDCQCQKLRTTSYEVLSLYSGEMEYNLANDEGDEWDEDYDYDDDDEDWDLEEHAGEDWDLEEHMEALDGSIDLNSKTPIVIKTPLSFEIDTASLDPFKDQWGFYNN
tara:strand:+ start:1016 stop:1993 length:978 start_codon:yes stop_codon:yes gene_type:complete